MVDINENELLPLRPNVCICLLDSEDRVLLGERYGESGVWQLPQGGVEAGLTLEQNVLKELEEEVGVVGEFARILGQLNVSHSYEFMSAPEYARGKWRGQAQTFWAVRFLGNDSQIDVIQPSPEFSNWRWCPLNELIVSCDPKRRTGYTKALAALGEFLGARPIEK